MRQGVSTQDSCYNNGARVNGTVLRIVFFILDVRCAIVFGWPVPDRGLGRMMTATSSQGLVFMWEMLYIAIGYSYMSWRLLI
jgi:hypothetical protein